MKLSINRIYPFVRYASTGGVGNGYKKDNFIALKSRDHRLLYVTGGKGEVYISGIKHSLKRGSTFLFPSGTEYMWYTTKIDIISINFDYTMDFSHLKTPFRPIPSEQFKDSDVLECVGFIDATILNSPIFIEDAYFIESLLRTMTASYYMEGAYVRDMLSAYLRAAIISIVNNRLSMNVVNTKSEYITIQRLINYIQLNYKNDLNNTIVAKEANFNPKYANKLFKRHTGTTIRQFIVDYRINRAKELLLLQNDSIANIARDVGFSDIPHFIKTFKKQTGKTPTEYRGIHD